MPATTATPAPVSKKEASPTKRPTPQQKTVSQPPRELELTQRISNLERKLQDRTIQSKSFATSLQHETAWDAETQASRTASEERFRLVLDGVKDFAVYMLDPQGRILSCNAGAVRLQGYSATEVMGLHYSLFYSAEAQTLGLPLRQLQAASANGRFEGECEHVRKDGSTFWANVVITPLLDDTGKLYGYSKVARDITALRQAQEAVRALNQTLEQRVADRTRELQIVNEDLEAFTYSVSHDLRAPLRHMAGFAKMLSEDYGSALDQDGQHCLQRIQEGSRHMGILVDDLLNLARIGRHELHKQVASLGMLVSEVITDLTQDIGTRQVEWIVGELPCAEMDPALMKVVFQNLLSNALKYSRPRAHTIIAVGHGQSEGHSVIFIRDNGVGFDMKYADKLFGVFQRLHRSEDFDGTGVGLAIVQRILQKHGGRIWARAAVDKGATFCFTLNGINHSDFSNPSNLTETIV